MSRHARIEDLGKITVLLERLMDSDLFGVAMHKDSFLKYIDKSKEENLLWLFNQIRDIHSSLNECMSIASGEK